MHRFFEYIRVWLASKGNCARTGDLWVSGSDLARDSRFSPLSHSLTHSNSSTRMQATKMSTQSSNAALPQGVKVHGQSLLSPPLSARYRHNFPAMSEAFHLGLVAAPRGPQRRSLALVRHAESAGVRAAPPEGLSASSEVEVEAFHHTRPSPPLAASTPLPGPAKRPHLKRKSVLTRLHAFPCPLDAYGAGKVEGALSPLFFFPTCNLSLRIFPSAAPSPACV